MAKVAKSNNLPKFTAQFSMFLRCLGALLPSPHGPVAQAAAPGCAVRRFCQSCQEFKTFCHILYIQHNIMLIIRIKAHLLLIVGNKIVTKKNEEIALWWASCAKVTKAL